MSKDAESWVWNNSDTNGNDRLVLVYLADQADDDGTNSFPSFRTIAKKCRINIATVGRVIGRLEADGEILVDRPASHGRGHFNRYTLVLGRPIEDVERLRGNGRDLRPFEPSSPARRTPNNGSQRTTTRAPDARIPTDPQTSGVSPAKTESDASDSRCSPQAQKTTKGSRLPDPFLVTADMHVWVVEHCDGLDYREQTARFADYWRAQPGQRGVKADWVGTWRNWMRRANDDRPRGRTNGNGHRAADAGHDGNMAELRELMGYERG